MAKMVVWDGPKVRHEIVYQDDRDAEDWAKMFKLHGFHNVRVIPVSASRRARAHPRRIQRR